MTVAGQREKKRSILRELHIREAAQAVQMVELAQWHCMTKDHTRFPCPSPHGTKQYGEQKRL